MKSTILLLHNILTTMSLLIALHTRRAASFQLSSSVPVRFLSPTSRPNGVPSDKNNQKENKKSFLMSNRGTHFIRSLPGFLHRQKTATATCTVRCFASTTAISNDCATPQEEASPGDQKDDDHIGSSPVLLHPDDFFDGSIPYPKSLSPSSINEFKSCPQSFLFQYLYQLRQPTSTALAKGSFCHTALEQIFDLNPSDRSLPVLQNLFRSEWSKHRLSDTYRFLFEEHVLQNTTDDDDDDGNDDNNNNTNATMTVRNLESEGKWGREGLALLENYWRAEDASTVPRPNPVQREVWVRADLALDPAAGVTAIRDDDESMNGSSNRSEQETFLVRGIIDRLDMVRTPSSSSGSQQNIALRLLDYKTGKAPDLKYTPVVNERIKNEAFYQLKIYALLLREKVAKQLLQKGSSASSSADSMTLPLRYLRLFYLTSVQGEAKYMDYDLGETQAERDAELRTIHEELSALWLEIIELVSRQDPSAFVGCNRSFCYCHKCRPKFVRGTVWEPSNENK